MLEKEGLTTSSRKIDLLLKFDGKEKVQLWFNEWKRCKISHESILKQQCKNIRINASILSNLISIYGNEFDRIMAMDWIGNVGYMHILKKCNNDMMVAELYNSLMIPTNLLQLPSLKSTLNNLFYFKSFTMNNCERMRQKSYQHEMQREAFNIIHQNINQSTSFPYIFLTPKSQRTKIRKFIPLSGDNDNEE